MPPTKGMTRPRPAILGLLGAAVAVALYVAWPAASKGPAPSNQPREQRKPATQTTGAKGATGRASGTLPGDLDVRLEALKQPPPEPEDAARNPFRFYVKPPPPPPPPVVRPPPPPQPGPGQEGYQPPPPPPPPPIPLRFIGTLGQGNNKWAIFSDGRGVPLSGKEGELILGQYRIVRIGVESVVMEYADGKGRQTIPMRGQ
jgi:hypothetical protein